MITQKFFGIKISQDPVFLKLAEILCLKTYASLLTKKELNSVIAQLNLQNVSETYIVCTPKKDEGYLESLLLETLPNTKKGCIQNFIQCSQINPKNFYKTIIYRLHAIAYPADSYYNFEDNSFDELKTKLEALFK